MKLLLQLLNGFSSFLLWIIKCKASLDGLNTLWHFKGLNFYFCCTWMPIVRWPVSCFTLSARLTYEHFKSSWLQRISTPASCTFITTTIIAIQCTVNLWALRTASTWKFDCLISLIFILLIFLECQPFKSGFILD